MEFFYVDQHCQFTYIKRTGKFSVFFIKEEIASGDSLLDVYNQYRKFWKFSPVEHVPGDVQRAFNKIPK